MSGWGTLIDNIAEHVRLLQELGVHRCEIDPTLLGQLKSQPPSPSVAPSAAMPRADAAASQAAAPVSAMPAPGFSVDPTCQRCTLAAERSEPPLAGEGKGRHPDIMFIAPVPLAPPDRELLHKMIEAMGYTPDELYTTAICKCRSATERPPTQEELRACMGTLREEIKAVSPRVIVLLGDVAVRGIFAATPTIIPQLNRWLRVNKRDIMPIRHPAYLRRFPTAKRDTWQALQLVLAHLKRSPPPRSGGQR